MPDAGEGPERLPKGARGRMSVGRRWRVATVAALAALTTVLCAASALRAQQTVSAGGGPLRTAEGHVGSPAPAEMPIVDIRAAAAAAVIEKHCAGCHRDTPAGGPASAARALSLAEAAADPALVRPGNPDASRLYLMLLRRLKPPDLLASPAKPGPDGEELHKVREWIEALPPVAVPACPDRPRARPGEAMALAQVVADARARASHHRFVTLAHLHDACAPDVGLEAWRDAVGPLLQAMTGTAARVVTEPVEATRSLLRIDLEQAGIAPAAWERIANGNAGDAPATALSDGPVREATGTAHAVLRADWLAHTALGSDETARRLGDALPAVQAMAREWRRPVHFARGAAELGIEASAIARLADVDRGAAGDLARRLVLGLVARAEFDRSGHRLGTAISAPPRPGEATVETLPAELPVAVDPGPAIALVSERVTYRVGDRLRIAMRTDSDCHAMLISLDRRGRATVLYPNDFEAVTLLPAGRELKVPADGAGYALRLKEVGTERIVALCSPAGPAIDGITHDLERQRFTDLGDYGTFLMQAMAAEAGRRAGAPAVGPPSQARRWQLQRRSRQPEPVPPRPEQVARTAISIEVLPAEVAPGRP